MSLSLIYFAKVSVNFTKNVIHENVGHFLQNVVSYVKKCNLL